MPRFGLLALLVASFLAEPAGAQYPHGYSGYGIDPNALVTSWSYRFLGRAPDPGSGDTVARLLQAGNTPEVVLGGILGSPEYYNRSGGTPEGFVQKLFLDLTGQLPSPRQLDYWVRRLYISDRGSVAYQVLSRHPGSWQTAPAEYDFRRPSHPYHR